MLTGARADSRTDLRIPGSAPAMEMIDMERSTRILAKIVATIGPASESPDVVRRLIEAGVSVFRFNFSHGALDDHARRLHAVRSVAAELGRTVGVLGDLQGPKIRVGKIPAGIGEPARSGGGSVVVQAGQDVVFKRGIAEALLRPIGGSATPEPVLPVTYEALIGEVEVGHRVLINDGAIRMLAVEKDIARGELRCRVVVGGTITSGKGINLPQSDISAPAITERDWECVAWAVEHDLDYLALSFVRRASEVLALREGLEGMVGVTRRPGPRDQSTWIPIVAKIEKPQALQDLDAIIEAADGIMVARGDLGVEMDIAQVPVAQERIIRACAAQGKPCIVATQMLETMIDSAIPTRAEASDVANAIFDGADAVMLSAETATGKHPVLVVETMARIIGVAEARNAQVDAGDSPPRRYSPAHRVTAALAHGAWHVARDMGAKVVACWSEHGGTARYLSQNNFNVPIVAYSSSARATRRMCLYAGVLPVCCQPPGTGTLSEWNAAVDAYVVANGLAKHDDVIVLLAGRPLGQAKATNTVTIHQVGRTTSGYRGSRA